MKTKSTLGLRSKFQTTISKETVEIKQGNIEFTDILLKQTLRITELLQLKKAKYDWIIRSLSKHRTQYGRYPNLESFGTDSAV
jgi:Arc/MetJ family transcription regulator